MNDLVLGSLSCLAAYLVGATPFGYLTGRIVGKLDIRQHGSGNIGATNVGRVLGTRWGLLVFVLDLLKGLLPVAVLPTVLLGQGVTGLIHWTIAAGVATILGHMFPCWLGFRGGKGVATALGVVAWIAPWGTLVAASVFALAFLIWRIISLASILAALSFAICQLILLWPALWSARNWSLTGFSLLVPALILLRHRSNIVRLFRGEEPKYRSGSASTASATPSSAEAPRRD
ncbi:MAG: glycerol-3-phosphate 1-O-acyltransferase PlsY [Planctomycetes bacterium]|nr:glycerol-3-phosphate 1-O-acyltransferase PlsY [Planctomycetota bacterium]